VAESLRFSGALKSIRDLAELHFEGRKDFFFRAGRADALADFEFHAHSVGSAFSREAHWHLV